MCFWDTEGFFLYHKNLMREHCSSKIEPELAQGRTAKCKELVSSHHLSCFLSPTLASSIQIPHMASRTFYDSLWLFWHCPSFHLPYISEPTLPLTLLAQISYLLDGYGLTVQWMEILFQQGEGLGFFDLFVLFFVVVIVKEAQLLVSDPF